VVADVYPDFKALTFAGPSEDPWRRELSAGQVKIHVVKAGPPQEALATGIAHADKGCNETRCDYLLACAACRSHASSSSVRTTDPKAGNLVA
jgi:hypothetical protein